jgi:hypothetical protein
MRRTTGLAAVIAAVAASAALASAAQASSQWQCRASAVNASVAGNPRVDPVATGGSPCASSTSGLDNLATPVGIPLSVLTAQTVSATTTATPANAAPASQTVGAVGRIENLALGLGAVPGLPGGPVLTLGVANAQASGVCSGGQPTLSGSSSVLSASLGGNAVPLDQLAQQLSAALGPLGALVDLKVDEQVRDGTSLTVNALHLKVLSAIGSTPLLDVVAGQARVGFDSGVCQNTEPNNHGGGGNSQSGLSADSGFLANGVRGGNCAHLRMYFVKNHKSSLKSRYGVREVVRGLIRNCQGKSIVRARIDVIHVIKGTRHLIKTGLRSREGGKLTLILPRNIKTRELRFEYRGNLRSNKVTSRSVLHITVRNRHGKILR